MDALFDTYAAALPRVSAWAAEQFPRRDGEAEAAHARAIKAKALDLLRGLLPAASLSHMGIFATRPDVRAADPAPARAPAAGGAALRADDPARRCRSTIPSFVTRVERPDRGGAWVDYLRTRAEAGARVGGAARARRSTRATPAGPSVTAAARRGQRGRPARRAAVRGERRAGGARARGASRRSTRERARGAAARPRRRAREPPPPPRARLRGAALPLRDRLRLRRLPRPAAPPHADVPVAGAHAAPRRRGAGGGRPRRLRRRLPPRARDLARAEYERLADAGCTRRRPTPSASATASATCST